VKRRKSGKWKESKAHESGEELSQRGIEGRGSGDKNKVKDKGLERGECVMDERRIVIIYSNRHITLKTGSL
jgi:hypothetical protein